MSRWRNICFSLGACGLIGAAVQWNSARKLSHAASYQQTSGQLVAADVVARVRKMSPSQRKRASSRQLMNDGERRWDVDFRYRYQVEGKDHEGTRYSVLLDKPSFDNDYDAEQLAERYSPGSSVPVFFDPAAPASAVLKIEEPGNQTAMAMGFGIAGLVVGILGLFL